MKHPSIGYSKMLVCLPTYQENACVVNMITSIRNLGFEVMVTDGGSTDGTPELAEAEGVQVLSRPGKGKGAGVIQATRYAAEKGFDYIAFLDCDMTYPVEALPTLYQAMESGLDMAVAARDFQKIKWLNRMANILFSVVISLLFWNKVGDSQTGMRALRVSKYNGLLTAENFDIESEIICKTLRKGYTFQEFPIDYLERVGESKVTIWDAFLILNRIVKERFRS